ncbi:hypothetical protein EV361DRAFT_990990 [Lentinula raphanica]|nr:hypothetical protein EV361DRAFT_990990 [Lentinula raphanica]
MANSEFHIELQYGPMLIGVFLNMILYGVLLNQMLFYYKTYPLDSIWVRVFVAYLLMLETANTAIDMAMMYQPLITEYGTQKAVMYFPTLFMLEPILIVLISTPIQTFFAWRIRKITGTYWIPGLVIALALASSVGGFITGIKIARPCVADLVITGTLVWNLAQRKTGFAITDSVVDKIIKILTFLAILIAQPTSSICAIGDVAFFMALPHTGLNFLWDLTLAKLYTNCLMSTLNARASLLRHSQNSSSGAQRNAREPSMPRGSLRISRLRPIDRYVEHPRSIMTAPHVYELDNTQTFDSTQSRSGGKTPYSLHEHQDVELGITVTKVVETIEDPIS